MRKIKNWKLFFESVEDSLEDIKWLMVDYDYDEMNLISPSNDLVLYRWGKSQSDGDYLSCTERVKRLAKQEGWNVDFVYTHYKKSINGGNLISSGNSIAIFYKGNLEDAIISYLNEKFGNLTSPVRWSDIKDISFQNGYSVEYSDDSLPHFSSLEFTISINKKGQTIATLEEHIYKIPSYCCDVSYWEDDDKKLIKIFKRWLLETYNIKADYIHLV